MKRNIDVGIIGGGAVGCAVARELAYAGFTNIYLFERNRKIRGENQSSRNSGVIHAGIYYAKDKMPLKARFCVDGNRLMYEFCEDNDVPAIRTGKLLVAVDEEEDRILDNYLKRGQENGVPGVEKISGEDVRKMEPNVTATSALYVPSSGIVEATEYVSRLHKLASERGANFLTCRRVVDIKPKGGSFELHIETEGCVESFECGILINAAGLYSDEIAKMVNTESPYVMEPVRGEAARFYRNRRPELQTGMNVYPTPHYFDNLTGQKLKLPKDELDKLVKDGRAALTVGLHLTPTFDVRSGRYCVGDTVTIGPTTTTGVGKEDYGSNLHPLEHFHSGVKDFFHGLRVDDLQLHQAGIRAKLKGVSDFVVERDGQHPNCINLVGIDSPGLTSSLAIAKHVCEVI